MTSLTHKREQQFHLWGEEKSVMRDKHSEGAKATGNALHLNVEMGMCRKK